MILGCDAAGFDEDGNEVVLHAVIGEGSWRGDETLDPKRSLLTERYQGTFAEQVFVPLGLIPSRPGVTFARRRACRPPGSPPTGCCSPGALPRPIALVQGAPVAFARPDRARLRRRPEGLRHGPRPDRARARPRARCGRGVRAGAPLPQRVDARHRDRRRGHLVALGQAAAARPARW